MMTTLKISITPEMRVRLMHADNIELDLPADVAVPADAYEFLADEYSKVLVLAGYAESIELAKRDAMSWIEPTKRPAVE